MAQLADALATSVFVGTDKLTAVRRQLPDEKYKYL